MAFLDFLDARIATARWGAKWFHDGAQRGWSDPQTIQAALDARYSMLALKPREAQLLAQNGSDCQDIFDLCHLVAQLELLNHLSHVEMYTTYVGDRTIRDHTFLVIDQELHQLGFSPGSTLARPEPPKTERSVEDSQALPTAVVYLVVGLFVTLIFVLGSHDRPPAPARENPPPRLPLVDPSAVPRKLDSRKRMAATPMPAFLSPELGAQYERLTTERENLELTDLDAVKRFNERAAEYKSAVEKVRGQSK